MKTLKEVALYRAQLKAKHKAKVLGRLLKLSAESPGATCEAELDDAQYASDDALAEVHAAEIELEAERAGKP